MTLGDLLVLYGAAGVASAAVVYRSQSRRGPRAALGALLALPLWPLWLPVVLRPTARPARPSTGDPTRAAIWEAHEAVVGSPLEALLPREAALRMLQEVERAGERHQELARLLSEPQLSAYAAEQRLESLVRTGASERGLAPVRLHLENVRRLEALRRRDEDTLVELGELAVALRAQLILARFSGDEHGGARDIVSEVWARVEVLGSTLEAPLGSNPYQGHAPDQAHLVG
ncbi:MAG: hypothetical protein EOO73_04430 [Myxococcales bacterium]|nr:MAG: hypothetical protein EOO73_04430 [Myxococcales bacterium]